MAKYEVSFKGDFDHILDKLENEILRGNLSSSLEEFSDFYGENSRCSTRVFERYSAMGRNRLTLSLTMYECGDNIHLSAITSGGSQAVLFKINTIGEELYLSKVVKIIDRVI